MGILDNAKEVANAVHEIKNIELYGRVLDLNAGIMDLVEENRKLHGENEDLKKTLHLREKMTFNEPFYYQEGDKTPFCPACWELNDTAIHVVFMSNRENAIRWDCKVCKSTYVDKKDRSVRRPQQIAPNMSSWA
jgi:hypothetical protein